MRALFDSEQTTFRRLFSVAFSLSDACGVAAGRHDNSVHATNSVSRLPVARFPTTSFQRSRFTIKGIDDD
jgi:hypothetical protein